MLSVLTVFMFTIAPSFALSALSISLAFYLTRVYASRPSSRQGHRRLSYNHAYGEEPERSSAEEPSSKLSPRYELGRRADPGYLNHDERVEGATDFDRAIIEHRKGHEAISLPKLMLRGVRGSVLTAANRRIHLTSGHLHGQQLCECTKNMNSFRRPGLNSRILARRGLVHESVK